MTPLHCDEPLRGTGPVTRLETDEGEAVERVNYRFQPPGLDRRDFVKVLGAGLVIAVSLPAAAQERGRNRGGGRGGGGAATLGARLHIGKDGIITVMTGKVECGQGARAQLTQAAAEELHAPAEAVRMVMADTSLSPDDGGTFGSRTTPGTVPAVRQGCVAARELLIALAVKRWGTGVAGVKVADGKATGEKPEQLLTYADLAADADTEKALRAAVPRDITLTPVKEWKVLGTSLPRPNGADVVTGRHVYPSDIVREGFLYGRMLRAPSFGAKLVSVDPAAIRDLKGVALVREGDFAGVTAPNTWLAQKAIKALEATAKWETAPHPASAGLPAYLKEHAQGGVPANPFAADLAAAARQFKQTYYIPYVQHCPMETRAAVAEWEGGALTVWTATQNPFGVRGELMRAFSLPENKVRVIVPDFGGGFGGKHSGECAVEAARLARAAGKPVRLVWTREEEFTWASFRPAGVMEVEAGTDASGVITSWHFVNINSGGAGLRSPYRIAKNGEKFVSSKAPLRHGSYRALASAANTFARESAMDELAHAAGRDPLEFRLAHLEPGRLREVLEAVARRFGWTERMKRKEPGTGAGIACSTEKGSFVAACAEVSVKDGVITLKQVCQAYECGKIMNPDNLMRQVRGGLIMGLGPALREESQFEGGKMQNPSFRDYAVPRFRDVPPVDIVLLDRPDLESVGAGETPLIAVAPAIANAVFAATGERLRSLPLRLPGAR